jgi:hypothetical protein
MTGPREAASRRRSVGEVAIPLPDGAGGPRSSGDRGKARENRRRLSIGR